MNFLKRTSNFLHKVAFIIDSDVNIQGMEAGMNEVEIGCHNIPAKTLKSIQDEWIKDKLIV